MGIVVVATGGSWEELRNEGDCEAQVQQLVTSYLGFSVTPYPWGPQGIPVCHRIKLHV